MSRDNNENGYTDIIGGRNSVLELLNSNKDVNKILIQKGKRQGSINKIIDMAKRKRIPLIEVDKNKLNDMSSLSNHQGVIAIVPPFNYCEVGDILTYAKSKNENPFIIILDGIEDPHNLGSIIRTAETAGVHGIIIPKRRAVGVNNTVNKVSSGAVEYVNIARVNNINETIKYLKQNGVWIIGTGGQADTIYYNQDMKDSIAIIIGNEGNGISRLIKDNCDFLVNIPMKGKITSLNASVSAGIIIYEVIKQRNASI